MFEAKTNNDIDTFVESATMPVVGIWFRNISAVECFISTAINPIRRYVEIQPNRRKGGQIDPPYKSPMFGLE